MMFEKDPLKARILYAVDGNSFEHKFITTESDWRAVVAQIEDALTVWVHVDAKVDDVDANRLRIGILREAIRSYDCINIGGLSMNGL